ncbi:MAG: hypothetical protein KGI27_15655, partial [Thaumarchaeota archaeon]|nr:hypothetical protein [Nitrososphaerota archaeon]
RNKCETIFSVIKRKFGSEIKSYNDTMMEKELLYRVLAYNCHRMCMISCLLWMVSPIQNFSSPSYGQPL